jgi:hypothetical protein
VTGPLLADDAGSTTTGVSDAAGDSGANAVGAHDAAPADAAVVVIREAGASGLGGCSLGEATSLASEQNLDLFGNVTYFAKGKDLPAGRYRVAYVDGCMKFSAALPWSVNNALSSGWWLVRASSADRIVALPGNADNIPFLGAASFEDCVTRNHVLEPKEFDFGGGKLGIWLDDGPYTDNLAGESGRNPRWQLTLLVHECPPELTLL